MYFRFGLSRTSSKLWTACFDAISCVNIYRIYSSFFIIVAFSYNCVYYADNLLCILIILMQKQLYI